MRSSDPQCPPSVGPPRSTPTQMTDPRPPRLLRAIGSGVLGVLVVSGLVGGIAAALPEVRGWLYLAGVALPVPVMLVSVTVYRRSR
jgi:hypothetical protein